MVVFLSVRPIADWCALAVAGLTQRPADALARGRAGSTAARHRALEPSMGGRIQDVPVHGAGLGPRGNTFSTRAPALRTAGRARTRDGFGGELSRDGLPGPRAASLSFRRAGTRYGSRERLTGRGKRAHDVLPHAHELAHRGGHDRHPGPARGHGDLPDVRRRGLVLGSRRVPQEPATTRRSRYLHHQPLGKDDRAPDLRELYEPREEEAGRERWLSYKRNSTARAWILRHHDEPRPWLICVHGIRMGTLNKSLMRFQPEYLHEGLGLNLLMPVLPLHGPRDTGLISGERTLSGDVMVTLHTGEQATWDLRRLVWWLRESEGASAIGALGHSLGGYTVSLLASLERDLDCVVAGNPAVNPSHLFWTDALAVATHSLSAEGIREETFEALLRPVSPLALEPVVPHERRGIFAGVVDRVVPPVEANSLWRHWDRPRIAWYQGAHQRFIRAPEGRKILEDTLRTADMLTKETTGTTSQR